MPEVTDDSSFVNTRTDKYVVITPHSQGQNDSLAYQFPRYSQAMGFCLAKGWNPELCIFRHLSVEAGELIEQAEDAAVGRKVALARR